MISRPCWKQVSKSAHPRKGPLCAVPSSQSKTTFAVVDVGLKTEGRVSPQGILDAGQVPTVDVGDEVEVYIERVENALGEAVLSRDKARREESWIRLEQRIQRTDPRHRRDLRPRQRRLHCRSRRRRGVSSWQPGRCAPDARCRPADEPAATVPDPQDGSPPRQYRRVASSRSRRAPRRGAFVACGEPGQRSRLSKAW